MIRTDVLMSARMALLAVIELLVVHRERLTERVQRESIGDLGEHRRIPPRLPAQGAPQCPACDSRLAYPVVPKRKRRMVSLFLSH